MTEAFDLPAYLARIGWLESDVRTLEQLSGLMRAHMAAIPFENLDVLLGRPIRLDPASLQSKLVHARRGGYCFEHTTLMAAALQQLGVKPKHHSARVVLITPRPVSPRTHMFLTVKIDGQTYVVDPGFGSIGPSGPVLLGGDASPQAGHVMAREGNGWVLRARRADGWADAWVSDLEESPPIDFEVSNHFTATHPSSPFVNRLMLRALIPGGYVGVMNQTVTTHLGGTALTSELGNRAALRALLVARFGFDLPEVERLRVPMIPDWT